MTPERLSEIEAIHTAAQAYVDEAAPKLHGGYRRTPGQWTPARTRLWNVKELNELMMKWVVREQNRGVAYKQQLPTWDQIVFRLANPE